MSQYSRIMWRYGGWELLCAAAITGLMIIGDIVETIKGRTV